MELRYWVLALLRCTTIEQFEQVLTAFSQEGFTLTEKAIVSAIYTPRLKRVLGEREEKGRILEDMGALCWRTNK